MHIMVRLRSTHEPVPASLRLIPGTRTAQILLDNPEQGISPGQAAVFHTPGDGARILGGGWITQATNRNAPM